MIINVVFQENECAFDANFGQVQTASDGGYERGYAAGYETGNAEGYTKGHTDGVAEESAKASEERQSLVDAFVTNSINEVEVSDSVTDLPEYLFYGASKLTRIKADGVKTIQKNCFYGTGLTTVVFPILTQLGVTSFQNCSKLATADLGQVTSIGASAFYSCSSLETLVVRNPNVVCNLNNTSVLAATKIFQKKGYIYVPDSLVEQYKTATNWSTFAAQIKPLSELEEST